MSQVNLTWGTLTLCSTADNLSGYDLTGTTSPKIESEDIQIPNSAGRVLRVVGQSLSDQTSTQYSFRVLRNFSDASAFASFLSTVESALADTVNPLRTLSYGLYDEAHTITSDNMALSVTFNSAFKSNDGLFLDFTATFSKYGGTS